MSPPSIAWRKDYLLGYPVRRAPSGLGEGSSPLYGKANVFSTRYSLGRAPSPALLPAGNS